MSSGRFSPASCFVLSRREGVVNLIETVVFIYDELSYSNLLDILLPFNVFITYYYRDLLEFITDYCPSVHLRMTNGRVHLYYDSWQ